MEERRADRSRTSQSPRPGFFFDLSCPFSYLASERIERTLGEVDWIPVAAGPFGGDGGGRGGACGGGAAELSSLRARSERRATELRLPLVWPDRFPAAVPHALRAAAFASEIGAGARFALAASRLAFCGGYDVEDPEILAEAAAAARVPLDACLAAARDSGRDAALQATAQGLRLRGARRVPAVRVGRRWFDGDGGLAAASSLLRAPADCGRPMVPAG